MEQNLGVKVAAGVDKYNLGSKSNLAKLKAVVNKIDIDKLKTVPADFSKLSNVINNEVINKLLMIN